MRETLIYKHKFKTLFGVFLFATIVLYVFIAANRPSSNLLINEVAYLQEDKVDWIEIYNPTLTNISLSGFYLSDSESDLTKFKISEDLTVTAGGYIIVYGDNYEAASENDVVANFRFAAGETIYLVAKDGESIIDSFFIDADSSSSVKDITLGRFPDGGPEIAPLPGHTKGQPNPRPWTLVDTNKNSISVA